MSTNLLRRFFGPILLLALLLLGIRPAQATHLLGGEMSYRYLDANGTTAAPFRYEVTVTIYSNGLFPSNPGITGPPGSAPITVYNRTTGGSLGNYSPARQGVLGQPVTPHVPAGCAVVGPSQPFYLCRYVQIVSVPFAADGYYAVFSLGARNNDIDNINNPGGQNLTLSVSMATPLIYNRSPVFSDTAVAIVCQNDTTLTLNNAYDADGDRLVYSFGTPYGGGLPIVTPTVPPTFTFTSVPYKAGYSATAPFGNGAGNFALLNASTGVAKYGGTTNGKYVVAVDVSEYRNINGREILIGTTRRDLQLVVATCPTTPPPVIPTLNVPRNYTIEEGQSVSIPITATQSSNHPLVLTVNSALLDGSGPFNTTFNGSTGVVQPGNLTGTATATGNGSVTGTFVYNSACGQGRANPYDISVRVQDNGCGGKLAVDIFRVTVNRAAGPTAINGATTVCDPTTVRTYTATGATPTSYNWHIVGGTITGGQGTSAVTVTWASSIGTGRLSVKGISAYGCPSDSVVQNVDIRPLPALAVTPTAPTICLGASTTLTVAGQAGLTYSWTGGGFSSTSTTVTVSPTATTTYTVTGTDGTCVISASVTVTVTPPPVANAGPARSICGGVTSTPLGVAPIAGATYLWSPAVGLSSTTVAQPTVTLPNNTSAPIVQTYTLTVTVNGNCTSVGTVNITVNPAAVADAGPARTSCANVASTTLGSTALAGYTYSWSPATGLSSSTAAQPTVTLPNTTGASITQTYTVTATTAQGCTATSTVVVTVSPAAVATPGPAVSFCSGGSATLGTAPVAGTTYSWSPATGLSSSTVANPTVTGTNTTGVPISTLYILSATTANGCIAIGTVTVTINPSAAADAGVAVSFCSGGTATLGGGTAVAGTTYAWSPTTGLSDPTALNPTVTLTNTTGANITQTYTLTATTAQGCTATATVTATVFPSAVATPGPAVSFCSGGSATLGTAPVAGTTYSWSPATGLSSNTVANPTVTGTNTTGVPIITTYTLSATTANGCIAIGMVVVTINPAAVADAGAAVSFCSGGTATLGGGTAVAGTTYAWTPTTGLSSATALSPTVTLTNTTGANITQTYTLTATTAQGCTATATVTATVFPAAVATPGPAVSFCSGGSATLGTTPVAGTTYSWSPATGLSSTTVANPTVTGINTTGVPIVTTYTLSATTANGCIAIGIVAVTINPAAVANAGPAVSTCSNVGVAIGSGTAVTGTTYAWTPTTGLSSATVLNPTVTLPNTGTVNISQTYTLTATTANGCTATSTVTVTVFPAAVANAGPAVTFCSGGTATLGSGTAVAGTTYTWSPTTGLSDPTVLSPTITLTNTTGAPITTTYTLTATTGNSCTATTTVAVTVNQAAVANAGPAKTTCSNVPVTLGSGTAVTGTTYSWAPATGLSSATVLAPTLTLANTTGAPVTYTYTLTATTTQGCTATSTVTVVVNPAAVADAGLAKSTCSNVGVAIGNATPVAGTTYAWSPATGLSSATVSNPTVTLANTGTANITQTYTLTATTANGCTATGTVTVTVFPAATALAGANQSVCSGLSVTLGAAAVTGYTYSWSPTAGLSSATVANPTFTQTNTTGAPIVTIYTLTATTANGCTATGTVTVTLNPAAVANAGPTAAVCDGKRITLGTAALTGYTYSWSPATNLSSTTAAQPVLTGVNTGTTPLTQTYTLTATTANGCVSTSSVTITINPRPAPSAITGPASVCPTVTGIAYSVVNPVGTAFSWLINGGTIASGQGTPAITVNWGAASTGGFIKVFSLNAQGCSSDTTTLPIIINLQLQTVRPTGPGDIIAVAPLPRSVCQADGPYTYTSGSFANGSSYSWVITGGQQVSTFQNTVTVQWDPVTTPTTGTIIVTETSNPAGGVCRGTSQALQVLINPSPRTNLAIASPVRVCQNSGPATFSLPGGFTGSTYVFQLNGTVIPGTGNTRTLSPLPATGTYSLTVRETTSAGCTGPLYTTPFTVNPTPAAPTISGSGFVCDVNTPQQYTIANPTAGASYQWTVVGGTITVGGTGSQITAKFNATGPYTVSAVEVSASPASCAGTATTRTITLDNPGVTLTLASVDPTSNNRVVLTLSAPNSGSTPNPISILRRVAGVGTFTQVATVPAATTTYTDNNAVDATGNSYEYQLGITNGCGTPLASTLAQTIRLVATKTTGQGGFDQGKTTLSWNAYVGFPVTEYRIYRRSDTGTAALVVPAPVITTSGSTLTATVPNADAGSAAGSGFSQNFRVVAVGGGASPLLSNSNEVGVTFDNNVKTYTVITPNHDGLNDVLVIDNIKLYPGNTLTIYNRWGREVYKATNYQNNFGLDDTIAPGVYYYLLTLPNGTNTKAWFEVVK